MSRPTEAEKIRQAVSGMPAPQALRYLAELIRPGAPLARGLAIAEALETIASTINADQQVVRSGLPVDSLAALPLNIREYALKATRPDGTEFFVT